MSVPTPRRVVDTNSARKTAHTYRETVPARYVNSIITMCGQALNEKYVIEATSQENCKSCATYFRRVHQMIECPTCKGVGSVRQNVTD